MKASACRNIADLRVAAFRRLPAPMFHFLEGGAEDERTVRANCEAFAEYVFVPTVLTDVSAIDMRCTLLGKQVAFPLMLSPTGASELFHHQAERAVARAARKAGIFYSVSCMATTSLEDIATAAGDGRKIFQLLPFKDRGLVRDLVHRAKAAGYDALCLTVDSMAHGNRERDLRTGLAVPPKITFRSWLSLLAHPSWSLPAFRHSTFRLANLESRPGETSSSPAQRVHQLLDSSATWKDAEWLAAQWPGPFLIKGVNSPEDVRRAGMSGASAVVISNHGGRQLDHTVAPFRQLPRIRDAIGDSLELIVDGGVRRGTDVLKAVALGATACSMGRPYLYGLAAFGEVGVERAIAILRAEIERDMRFLGCANLQAIRRDHVVPTTDFHNGCDRAGQY